jgi:hypothetical protein
MCSVCRTSIELQVPDALVVALSILAIELMKIPVTRNLVACVRYIGLQLSFWFLMLWLWPYLTLCFLIFSTCSELFRLGRDLNI